MEDRDDEPEETEREIARRKVRSAGKRSASAARTLMQLPEGVFKELDLDEEVREAVRDARAVTSHVARRRAERRLAGVLRKLDMTAVSEALTAHDARARADARSFQLAEQWRQRLIEGGPEAFAEWLTVRDGLDPGRWRGWVDEAQSEKEHGKPRGAARALFRQIMAVLRQRAEDGE